jgi:hypothetical protein
MGVVEMSTADEAQCVALSRVLSPYNYHHHSRLPDGYLLFSSVAASGTRADGARYACDAKSPRRWAIDNLHDVEMDGRLIVVRAEQSMQERGTTPDEFQGANDNVYDRMPDGGGPPRKEFHDQWQNTKVFVSQLRCGH